MKNQIQKKKTNNSKNQNLIRIDSQGAPISRRRAKILLAYKKKNVRKQMLLKEMKESKILKNKEMIEEIKNPIVRKGKTGRIILRNLIVDINEKLLTKLVSKFGKIEEMKIPMNPENDKPRGFAFVQFETKMEAMKAIQELDASMYKGRKITAKFAVDKRLYKKEDKPLETAIEVEKPNEVQIPQEAENGTKIIEEVEGEEQEQTNPDEEDFLEIEAEDENEEVVNHELKKEIDTGAFEGNKQVFHEAEDDAEMNKTIFVRNIEYETTEEQFTEQFKKFGDIYYAKLVFDSMGDNCTHRGVGFVKFKDAKIATSLIEKSVKIESDFLLAEELDPNNWLEFNGKKVKVMPALKRETIAKIHEDKSKTVDVRKFKRASAMKIIEMDIGHIRNMSLGKLGLPVLENNLKIFMKNKGKSQSTSEVKGQEKVEYAWRQKHLNEKVMKMRNANYKINPKRIILKGISKELDSGKIRKHLYQILSEEGFVPEKMKTKRIKIKKKTGKTENPEAEETPKYREVVRTKATWKELQRVKLFKQVKTLRDPLKKERLKGIVFVEFMEPRAAKMYMEAISRVENYRFLQGVKKSLPIIEFTFMDMRTEKKMAGIKEKMKKNSRMNDPKQQLIESFKSKTGTAQPKKENVKLKTGPVQKDNLESKLKNEAYDKILKAIASKDVELAKEACRLTNKMKSRGKRQRFFKKLNRVFKKEELFPKKQKGQPKLNKKIQKEKTKTQTKIQTKSQTNGLSLIKKKQRKTKPVTPKVPVKKLDNETQKELEGILGEIDQFDGPKVL